jgi:hypothetical protein
MTSLSEQDVTILTDLLRRTREFIAYFELAETKMMAWRETIEHQSEVQQELAAHQLKQIHQEIQSFLAILTDTGLSSLKHTAEQTERHLHHLEQMADSIVHLGQNQQETLHHLAEVTLLKIEQHSVHLLNQQDPSHFKRIAHESYEQVEKVATHVIHKGNRLLRAFQWQSASIAVITTLIVSFVMSLYMSNEMPWEMHQHAREEREAGKALMSAWPRLSAEEQHKIMPTHLIRSVQND